MTIALQDGEARNQTFPESGTDAGASRQEAKKETQRLRHTPGMVPGAFNLQRRMP